MPQFHLLPYGTAALQATARSGLSGPFASCKDAWSVADNSIDRCYHEVASRLEGL